EAIDAYRKAVRFKEDYPHAWINLGNALRRQGRLNDAIEAYRQANKLAPDDASGHYHLGAAFQLQGRPKEAIEAYRAAIAALRKQAALAGKDRELLASCCNHLGAMLGNMGQVGEAESAFDEALAVAKGLLGQCPGDRGYQCLLAGIQGDRALLFK